jgi:hypothetical protein
VAADRRKVVDRGHEQTDQAGVEVPAALGLDLLDGVLI